MKTKHNNRKGLILKFLSVAGIFALLIFLVGKTSFAQSGETKTIDPFFSPPPTTEDIKKWQDRSTYAVWLDDRLLTPDEVAAIDPEEVAFFMPTPVDSDSKFYSDHQVQVVVQTHQNFQEKQHQRGVEKQNEFYNNTGHPYSKIEPKHPNAEQLTAWLSEKRYGIWLDGKRVKNSELLTFSTEDIFYYAESKLARNAVNFGKHDYQVDLLTEAAFLEFQRSTPISPPENQ